MKNILSINGGSSSIKFALYDADVMLKKIFEGSIERIGLSNATLQVKGLERPDNFSRGILADDHTKAVGIVMDWIGEHVGGSLDQSQMNTL